MAVATLTNYPAVAAGAVARGGRVVAAAGARMPAWLAAANPAIGQYVEIPGTALSSCPPTGLTVLKSGQNGPSSKIVDFVGAAFNRLTGRYTIQQAGGHLDYAGNESNEVCIFDDWPAWIENAPASADEFILVNSDYNLDRRPASTHTYWLLQSIDSLNQLICMPQAGTSFGANPPADWPWNGTSPRGFDSTTNQYLPPETHPKYPGNGDSIACLCVKDPITEMIYYSRNYADGFYRYDPHAKVWTKLSGVSAQPWYAGSAIDSPRGRMLNVGGFSPQPPSVMGVDGQQQFPTLTGPNVADLTTDGYPGLVFDERNDKYLVFRNKNGIIDNFRVDAATFYVDRPARTGAVPTQRAGGVNNSVQYVPNIGGLAGCVGANTYDGNMFFLRTA